MTPASSHGAVGQQVAGQQKHPPPHPPLYLVDLSYWEDPRILCSREACRQFPFHPSSGCHMATHFMLAHKAVPHGCRHLSFTFMCFTIPTTQLSPHGTAGQQKHRAREQSLSVGECDRGVDIIPLTVWLLTFMLAHKAAPHGCRHLLFTSMCSTIPTSPDSGLTSRCSWTAKANPPPCALPEYSITPFPSSSSSSPPRPERRS